MRGTIKEEKELSARETVKAFVLKSLEQKKNRLLKGNLHNLEMAKKNVAEWQKEIDTKQMYSNDGFIKSRIYKDTNEKLIKEEKAWIEKAEKVVEECNQAIDFVTKNY